MYLDAPTYIWGVQCIYGVSHREELQDDEVAGTARTDVKTMMQKLHGAGTLHTPHSTSRLPL